MSEELTRVDQRWPEWLKQDAQREADQLYDGNLTELTVEAVKDYLNREDPEKLREQLEEIRDTKQTLERQEDHIQTKLSRVEHSQERYRDELTELIEDIKNGELGRPEAVVDAGEPRIENLADIGGKAPSEVVEEVLDEFNVDTPKDLPQPDDASNRVVAVNNENQGGDE